MVYKVYGDTYKKGWELIIIVSSKEFLETVIDSIDETIYRGYMIIEFDMNTKTDTPIKTVRFDEQPKVKKRK